MATDRATGWKIAFWYYTSARLIRGVGYGVQPRQIVDIYLPPEQCKAPAPVIVFITGGAWLIGYRAWGALLARRLSLNGALVFCLDYRNYPMSAKSAEDMLQDVNTGIRWVTDNCAQYGGDVYKIHLCAHSAGTHISTLALLLQCQRVAAADTRVSTAGGQPDRHGAGEGDRACDGLPPSAATLLQRTALEQLTEQNPWEPALLRSFIGVSGPYNLPPLRDHFQQVGLLNRKAFDQIMSVDGRPAVEELSPLFVARRISGAALRCLPPMHLLHGSLDKTIPCRISEEFAQELRALDLQQQVTLRIYAKGTHTSPLLENPMRGGSDALTHDILSVVFDEPGKLDYQQLCPTFLINMAAFSAPF